MKMKVYFWLVIILIFNYSCTHNKILLNSITELLFLEKRAASVFEGELVTFDIEEDKAYHSNMSFLVSTAPRISPNKKYLIFDEYEYFNEHLFVLYCLDSNKVTKSIKTGVKYNHILMGFYNSFDFLNDSILVFNDKNNLYSINLNNGKTILLKNFESIILNFSINTIDRIISLCLGDENGILGDPKLFFYIIEKDSLIKTGFNAKRVSNWSPNGKKLILSDINKAYIYNNDTGGIDSTLLSEYRFKDHCSFLDNENIIVNFSNEETDGNISQIYILNSRGSKKNIYENNSVIESLQINPQ